LGDDDRPHRQLGDDDRSHRQFDDDDRPHRQFQHLSGAHRHRKRRTFFDGDYRLVVSRSGGLVSSK
ncbi:hypothetical protein GNI_158370, partial [Gregarina niphandrodes]